MGDAGGVQMPLGAVLMFNKSLRTLDLHASCLSAMSCDYLLPGLKVGSAGAVLFLGDCGLSLEVGR